MSFDPTGYTLAHEHLHIDLSGFKNNVDCRLDQYAFICQEMNDLMTRGVRNVIEMTNRYMGRNAQFMLDVMRETGINVVACTGYYQDAFFPEHVATRSVQELAQERMEQNAQTLLETFPDSGRTGYLLRRTFDEVTQVVDELYDELSVSAFRPKFCELEFSARGALPGVAFAGERCRGVVEGFVDRVDVWQSGGRPYVRVVDYKTGKKSFDYTNVLHGRGLQMLLYLFALVRQGGHLLHGEPLPAGVLYFPARIERVSVRDRLAQAEIEKERRKQLRRSGVLLNSDPVLEAMEPCGGSPRFLPYTLDKEGRKTGDLASFAQLAQLERFVFRTVAALGDELADGRIDPDPCIRDAKDSACAFCPYSEICAGHEQPRWLKKITAEEFWQTLERREHG